MLFNQTHHHYFIYTPPLRPSACQTFALLFLNRKKDLYVKKIVKPICVPYTDVYRMQKREEDDE